MHKASWTHSIYFAVELQVLAFVKAFLLVSEGNKVAIFAVHDTSWYEAFDYCQYAMYAQGASSAETVLAVQPAVVCVAKPEPQQGSCYPDSRLPCSSCQGEGCTACFAVRCFIPPYKTSHKSTSHGPVSRGALAGAEQIDEGPALAGALSRVLCFLHGQQQGAAPGRDGHRKTRVLCLQASADISAQYIPFMNAVFSAQARPVVLLS